MPAPIQGDASVSVSPWRPLRIGIFRNLLVADLVSDIGGVLAAYLFVFQGSVAIGSVVWGFTAEHTTARMALLICGVGIGASLLLQIAFRLPSTAIDLSTWNHWSKPHMFEEHASDLGPVLVTVKYVIDPAKAAEFLNEIYRYQRIRRRDGATRWRIYFDAEAPPTYLETFLVDSWLEHERQHDRFTVADHELQKRLFGYTVGKTVVKHYIYAKRTGYS
jgi:Transmembrane secretion effector